MLRSLQNSSKSLMVTKWMFGVSYQRKGRLSETGGFAAEEHLQSWFPMSEVGKTNNAFTPDPEHFIQNSFRTAQSLQGLR